MSDEASADLADGVSPVLAAMPAAIGRSLLSTADALAVALTVTARSLASGEMVEARSGHYRDSLHAEAVRRNDGVDITLASSSYLAHLIEDGARIPPHDEMVGAGKAMRFDGGAGEVFTRTVHDPGGTLPARPVMHTAVEIMSGRMSEDLREAVTLGIRDAQR